MPPFRHRNGVSTVKSVPSSDAGSSIPRKSKSKPSYDAGSSIARKTKSVPSYNAVSSIPRKSKSVPSYDASTSIPRKSLPASSARVTSKSDPRPVAGSSAEQSKGELVGPVTETKRDHMKKALAVQRELPPVSLVQAGRQVDSELWKSAGRPSDPVDWRVLVHASPASPRWSLGPWMHGLRPRK